MPFIPHTPDDVEQMLAAIGAKKIEDLFDEIPKNLRIESLAGIPDALNEMQIGRLMTARAAQDGLPLNFIGAGIGFGKSQEQNLELLAKLEQLIAAFPEYPLLIGTSRKSFIGRILADESGTPAPAAERLYGSLATISTAIMKGAHIVRVHDVKATLETIRLVESIRDNQRQM